MNDLQEADRLLRDGRERDALRVASRLKCLGSRRDAIQSAWSSSQNPDFYRSIGRDPDALLSSGLVALRELIGEIVG